MSHNETGRHSKKISNFTAQTNYQAGDLINIVRNGTNFKVDASALSSFLGTTGTITSVGGTGSPVLEQLLNNTNNIRILENGNGILTSISAQNGIKISHNFTQNVIGVPIVDNLDELSPTFPSLLPGDGIGINRVNDVITINTTGVLPATKVVSVNELSDFPTAVAGVITLEDDTVYVISNTITTADRFVMGLRTTITGWSFLGPLLEYTGTGTMFTAVDNDCVFLNLRLNAPLGKVWDITRTTGFTGILIDNVAVIFCDTVGDFNAMLAVNVNSLVVISATSDGILFTGTGQTISLVDFSVLSSSATFTAVDLGTSISDNVTIAQLSVNAPSGAVGINGAAGDANISATGLGTVTGSEFRGDVTPITGLVVDDDILWSFLVNQGIKDTLKDSLSVNTAGTVVTISSVGVPVKVGGTWVDDNSSQFTVDGTGRVTYNGIEDLHAPVDISVTADPVSGSNKDFAICLAINGTVIVSSKIPGRASTSDLISLSVPWQHEFSNGDYAEVFIQNDTDATNFNVSHAILRIN